MCSGAGDGERNGHNKTDQETGTSSRRLAWERTKRQRAQDTESDVELHQKGGRVNRREFGVVRQKTDQGRDGEGEQDMEEKDESRETGHPRKCQRK